MKAFVKAVQSVQWLCFAGLVAGAAPSPARSNGLFSFDGPASEEWGLVFSDGTRASSSDVRADAVSSVVGSGTDVVRRTFATDDAIVCVETKRTGLGKDAAITVKPLRKTVRAVDFPSKLRFDPKDCERMIFPADKSVGTGFAFKRSFFRHQEDPGRCVCAGRPRPRACGSQRILPHGFGGGALDCAPVRVTVTPEGERLFPTALVSLLKSNDLFRVNRATAREDADVVLVDSPAGPFVTGSRLGGKGALWRIGQADPHAAQSLRRELIRGLGHAAFAGHAAPRLAVIAFSRGPKSGSFVCGLSVADVVRLFSERHSVSRLEDFASLEDALRASAYDAVINPYGESFPCASEDRVGEMERLIAAYVRRGGNWLELGGHSFLRPLVPIRYHRYQGTYPSLFCDFVRLEGTAGASATIYTVRSRPFVPGRLACGGDEHGGSVEHGFATWIAPGTEWRSPVVRVRENQPYQADVDAYVAENRLARPLADKAGRILPVLREAPLFFLAGTAAELTETIPLLKKPTLVHTSRYLHGGFDRQYPDHLPPSAKFGTPAEFRRLLDALHAAGHLFSPYTNPTWWCDDPPGETLRTFGAGAAAVDASGKRCNCWYGPGATGFAVSFFHPNVRRANERTRQAFMSDYPSDILFQDECGARHMPYDFNAVAPSPTAYLDGLLTMLDGDSRRLPLGTEEGWDQVAARETMMCGLHWQTIPLSDKTELVKTRIPPELWEYEALAQRMMHERCLFLLHDLGGFVDDRRALAWCLALGYHLSVRMSANELKTSLFRREWYDWLAELQRRVVSRMDGGRVGAFRHDRAPLFARGGDATGHADDGVVTARYGDVRLWVNLGDVPRELGGRRLAAYGWFASSPGLEAGHLDGKRPSIRDAEGFTEYKGRMR